MRLGIMIVLLAAAGLGKPVPPERSQVADSLLGTWQVISLVEKGRVTTGEQLSTMQISIQADKFVVKKSDDIVTEITYKLDANAKPRAIDLTPTEGPTRETRLGIYALQGGRLKIELAEEGEVRPTDFGLMSKVGVVIELKRMDRPANP